MTLIPPSLPSIPGAVQSSGPDACLIDWPCVQRALESKGFASVELEECYQSLARDWLMTLAEGFGGEFRLYESPNFLILTPRGRKLAKNLVRLGEKTFETMTSQISSIAKKSGHGKFVCIVADNIDRYYAYLDALYPSQDHNASSGVFISRGYAHFVPNHSEPWSQEHTFVHELTHALVQEADLPLWLEEGVTQLMENTVFGSEFHLDRFEVERHHRYWHAHGLSDYWTGESFSSRDDGYHLSYDLSQVIVRNMLSRSRKKFLRFLEIADSLDYGDEASRQVFGCSLGEWAHQFLGPR